MGFLLKEHDIKTFSSIREFFKKYDEGQGKHVIIFNPSVKELRQSYSAEVPCYLRTISNYRVKLVLYSDFEQLRYGYLNHLTNPDCVINKKSPVSEIEGLISNFNVNGFDYRNSDETHKNKAKHLTRREFEYLTCFLKGMTVEDISKKLGRSKKTIYSHRRSILVKYGLKNSSGIMKSIL